MRLTPAIFGATSPPSRRCRRSCPSTPPSSLSCFCCCCCCRCCHDWRCSCQYLRPRIDIPVPHLVSGLGSERCITTTESLVDVGEIQCCSERRLRRALGSGLIACRRGWCRPPKFGSKCFSFNVLLKFRASPNISPFPSLSSPGTPSIRRSPTPATTETPTPIFLDTPPFPRTAKRLRTPGPFPKPRVTTRSCTQVQKHQDVFRVFSRP